MIFNYLRFSFRNMFRNKGYTALIVFGLAVGIAVFMLISTYVLGELSYDKFHEKSDRIYRVNLDFSIGTNEALVAMTPCPVAEVMKEEFPEVEAAARIFPGTFFGGDLIVRYENDIFREKKFFWADASIFDIMTIQVVSGSGRNALENPNSVILTEETANRYFGKENPLGKTIVLDDGTPYQVTGVCKSFPQNSHLKFDLLASFSTLPKSHDPEWYDIAVYSYVLLHKQAGPRSVAEKIPGFQEKYLRSTIEMITGSSYEDFLKGGNNFGFELQALTDIHLQSNIENESEPTTDFSRVLIFGGIAVLIILVAAINFINLTTARAINRGREVGVRKAIGSTRHQLIIQFLTESVLHSLIAFIFAQVLISFVLPVYNNLIGKDIALDVFANSTFILSMLAVVIFIGIGSGLYPAILLSSFKPVETLKGKLRNGISGARFRNSLVVFQFAVSVILILASIVIYHQLSFMASRELGLSKDNILVLADVQQLENRQSAFKNRLMSHNSIISASYSDCIPFSAFEVKPFQKPGESQTNTLVSVTADYDFLKTFNIKIEEGRFFDREFSRDSAAVLVNQAAVQALDLDDPLNSKLILALRRKMDLSIIGILSDFHIEPLHNKVRPLTMLLMPENRGRLLSVRVQPGQVDEAVVFLEKEWKKFMPGQIPDHTFFVDNFRLNYQAEMQTGKVTICFSVLAGFIACLGLFGLSLHAVEKRSKEIGVRKVLGATTQSITILLIKDFLKWVVIANVVALPLAWFIMEKWLQNFAYRINMSVFSFIVTTLISVVIAVMTVWFQSVRTAMINPVKVLKYE